jgi:predicted RNA-binding protein Jag
MTESNPQTVKAEGTSVMDAVRVAAGLLGVPTNQVGWKLDPDHFRNELGRARAVDTVMVIAWVTEAKAAPAPAAPREPREAREPREPRERREPRESRERHDGNESHAPVDEAGADAARLWLAGLIERMGLTARVRVRVSPDKLAELRVDSDDGRHLVGRQGSTLHAIHTLLEATMAAQYSDWTYRIDIADARGERGDRGDRGGNRDRDDRRGPRDDRRPRDERPGGPPRDDRRGPPRGDRRSDQEIDELRQLAARLASEVAGSGEPVIIRRELNSYERRVVHMVIAEIDGVESESVGDGAVKQVRIMPAGSGANAE